MSSRALPFVPAIPSTMDRERSRALRQAARSGLASAVAAGAAAYDRLRLLPRLIALDPRDIEKGGAALDELIHVRLACALRAERTRGRAGHWTYDLNRHIALAQALAAETTRGPAPSAPPQKQTPPGDAGGVV